MENIKSKFSRAIVIGTSTIAIHCAKMLVLYGLSVEVIEYQRSEVSPLKHLCAKESIHYSRLNKSEITNKLLEVQDECLIVSAFSIYLFPAAVVVKSNLKIINYHNSLLPKYAGRNAEAWVIYMQERETGITWHYVNESIDNGAVICQKVIPLLSDVTSIRLLKLQHEQAISAFDEILPDVLSGVQGKPQNKPDPQNLYNSKNIPNGGVLDITWSAKKIYAFIRSMDYGTLNSLGKPSLLHNDKRYIWKNYKFVKTDYNCTKNHVDAGESYIKIICNGADIVLNNPQVFDE